MIPWSFLIVLLSWSSQAVMGFVTSTSTATFTRALLPTLPTQCHHGSNDNMIPIIPGAWRLGRRRHHGRKVRRKEYLQGKGQDVDGSGISNSPNNMDSSFLLYLDSLDKVSFFSNVTTRTNGNDNVTLDDAVIFPLEAMLKEESSQQQQSQQQPPRDSIAHFAQDVTTVLKELRSDAYDPTLPKLFRQINMPSFTNVWSQKDWDLHTSRWRYLKYLYALPTSRLLRRIAPQLLVLGLWASVACWMCSKETQGILSRAVLPLTPLSLVSTFVAGLLTLRSNQGLSRLNEGRLAFGKVVLYTRDMAQLIATILYPRNQALGLLAARHVALFGWLMKDFLRHYDEDYTRPLETNQPQLCRAQDIVKTMLPSSLLALSSSRTSSHQHHHHHGDKEDADDDNNNMSLDARYILRQRKKPVAVCTRLRQIFGSFRDQLTTSEQSRLDGCAQQLNECIMVCERIRASPIPPLYTAHAGRLLIFYLFFLPLALRGSSLLNNVGTIITTTVVGYAMLGLDEISHVLEEPFRLMPLYHLSKNSMKDVADAMVCMPPPLPLLLLSMEEVNHDNDCSSSSEPRGDIDNTIQVSGKAQANARTTNDVSDFFSLQGNPAYW
jgi:predicted membrane chloride channel (bestrophin family)